jgi:S-adenosylmethionine hydrolase
MVRRQGDRPVSRISASPRLRVPVVTLLTDFGTTDYFVGAVKGAILSVNPTCRIVDITHDIPPHDIEAAAFTLLAAHGSFPPGAIHVAVVDPGVGSSRKPLVVKANGQLFVGPDNGIFSYVVGDHAEVFHLTNTKYFAPAVSNTFHGRDIFAPAAGALSKGVLPSKLGKRIDDFVRLPPLAPNVNQRGEVVGRVIHIDRFGNCVTNITRKELSDKEVAAGAELMVRKKRVKSFKNFYGEEPRRKTAFCIWGSAGFLEIAAENGSAANLLKVRRGDPVEVIKR